MGIILFDEKEARENLLPLTFTRPISEIRVGILKIVEKWKHYLSGEISYLTPTYLQEKFKTHLAPFNLYINGSVLPNQELADACSWLTEETGLMQNGKVIAIKTTTQIQDLEELKLLEKKITFKEVAFPITSIAYLWDIFLKNRQEIIQDFQQITQGRTSQPISDPYTRVYGVENVFLEEGAETKAAILNAENGCIYLGKNSKVGEGSMIRGSFALGEKAQLSMGTKIKGDTTVGSYAKVGGEVGNSVVLGYSNKGHDGYLGNSVIGEWCNLGADTNNSNLKNNYSEVKVWNYGEQGYINSGQTFCGLFMGDHSKAGINTMFNTGTVVGVSANIFGGGFPPKFIPSFSWGGSDGFVEADFEKMCQVAERVMERKGKSFDEIEKAMLMNVFQQENTSFKK